MISLLFAFLPYLKFQSAATKTELSQDFVFGSFVERSSLLRELLRVLFSNVLNPTADLLITATAVSICRANLLNYNILKMEIMIFIMTNNLVKNMNTVVNWKGKINILFIGTEPIGRTFYYYTTFTQHPRTKKVVKCTIIYSVPIWYQWLNDELFIVLINSLRKY